MRACCDLAGPLRHAAGFPGFGLLRVLRPVPATSADDGPSRPPARRPMGEGPPGRFPRSLHDRLSREAPSYAPAASPRLRRSIHRGLPTGDINRPKEFAADTGGCARQPSPDPPGWSWWSRLRGVQTLVSHVHLLVLLAGPEPSGSTGPSRRCRGCCPPSPASPGSGCPQLVPACCDKRAAVSFHHRTVKQRPVALEVRHPQRVGTLGREVAVDEVRASRRRRIADRGASRLAAPLGALDALLTHQALDVITADALAGAL